MDSNGNNLNAGLENGGDINGILNIDPDLNVTGTITCDIIEANTLVVDLNVEDPLIEIAVNNPADALNTGVFSEYQSSGTKYAGLIRSKDDKKFYLSNNDTIKPLATNTIANRQGNLKMGQLEATQVNINDYALPLLDGSLNQVIRTDGNGVLIFADNTTASNIGGGIEIFKEQLASDLKFKTIEAGSSKLTIVDADKILIDAEKKGNKDGEKIIINANILIKKLYKIAEDEAEREIRKIKDDSEKMINELKEHSSKKISYAVNLIIKEIEMGE